MSYTPAAAMPGEVRMFAGPSAPSGWIICNGSAISRTQYADLYAIIGTTYGVGDGITTFNLPNCSGIFVRGAGSQIFGGIAYSGTLTNRENDQMQGHYHAFSRDSTSDAYYSMTGGTTTESRRFEIGGTSGDNVIQSNIVRSAQTDGTNGSPRNGSQTHPANITMNYIIKV